MQSKIEELKSTDPRLTVGRFTYGNPRLLMWDAKERISLGSFCSIAEEVAIFGGGEHVTNWVTTFPMRIAFGDPLAEKDGHPASKGPTVIGHDVWIGFRAIILSGVTIGSGAVIGAGAVVSQDVPPYAIVGGNPATVLRYRFAPDIVQRMLVLAWWDWDIEKIERNIPLMCATDIETFLKIHELT
jgi:chloramphenicol O-acetyltransferase type B